MKIRKNLTNEDLKKFCMFLESVLTDKEICTLAGMLFGGQLAKCFPKEWKKVSKE
jgi:hypothetical protein